MKFAVSKQSRQSERVMVENRKIRSFGSDKWQEEEKSCCAIVDYTSLCKVISIYLEIKSEKS